MSLKTNVLERDPQVAVDDVDVIRAWRDETYHEGLTDEQRALLPGNPAGEFDPEFDLKPLMRSPVMCLSEYGSGCCTCVVYNHTQYCSN